jgi:hypothetical protein
MDIKIDDFDKMVKTSDMVEKYDTFLVDQYSSSLGIIKNETVVQYGNGGVDTIHLGGVGIIDNNGDLVTLNYLAFSPFKWKERDTKVDSITKLAPNRGGAKISNDISLKFRESSSGGGKVSFTGKNYWIAKSSNFRVESKKIPGSVELDTLLHSSLVANVDLYVLTMRDTSLDKPPVALKATFISREFQNMNSNREIMKIRVNSSEKINRYDLGAPVFAFSPLKKKWVVIGVICWDDILDDEINPVYFCVSLNQ